MHVSAPSLAADWLICKATPSDNTERTARSGAVVETIFCQDHGMRSVDVPLHAVVYTHKSLHLVLCPGSHGDV